MYHSDYLDISNSSTIENFSSGSGSVGGGNFAGSGSVSNSRSSASLSPSSTSQGGGKIYGSFDYASVSPITGAMSGISNPQPSSSSSLGIIKSGAKTGTYTGGSFGGDGKYVIGFPGIVPGSTLPASSSPSLYMKPKLTFAKPTFYDGQELKDEILPNQTFQDVTRPYGHIEKHMRPGIPGPKITNKYDNVGCNFATQMRGPKFPYGFDLRDKNLTGYYGYSGNGYFLDPFYWGYGPFYPINGVIFDYPNPPFNYEDLMQRDINADYMVNTIQNQLATQYMETEIQKQIEKKMDETEEPNEKQVLTDSKVKETFEIGIGNKPCGKNTIIIILAVVLIIYILLSMATTETERNFSL